MLLLFILSFNSLFFIDVFRINVCFGRQRRLLCPNNQLIKINFATFGRHRLKSCNPYENSSENITDYINLSVTHRQLVIDKKNFKKIRGEKEIYEYACISLIDQLGGSKFLFCF